MAKSEIIPGSFADWLNYRLGARNGTYPKPTVGPDYEAMDEAKGYAMERFERDYDLFLRDRGESYWQYSNTLMDDGNGNKFTVKIEMEDLHVSPTP